MMGPNGGLTGENNPHPWTVLALEFGFRNAISYMDPIMPKCDQMGVVQVSQATFCAFLTCFCCGLRCRLLLHGHQCVHMGSIGGFAGEAKLHLSMISAPDHAVIYQPLNTSLPCCMTSVTPGQRI